MGLENALAEKLRKLRKERGFTQEELALKSGLDYKYIQMLEGKTPPSATLRSLNKLSKAFGITVSELLELEK